MDISYNVPINLKLQHPPGNPQAFECHPYQGIRVLTQKLFLGVENLNPAWVGGEFPAEYTWLFKVVLVWRSSKAKKWLLLPNGFKGERCKNWAAFLKVCLKTSKSVILDFKAWIVKSVTGQCVESHSHWSWLCHKIVVVCKAVELFFNIVNEQAL